LAELNEARPRNESAQPAGAVSTGSALLRPATAGSMMAPRRFDRESRHDILAKIDLMVTNPV
jgi:hypothetical protein